jgi:mRNA-degrading endonuclease toxin of MazEF toxin-antitoxin module
MLKRWHSRAGLRRNLARGDVVILDFPQAVGPPKRRPAIVVQSDHNNGRLTNSIFAMVTSKARLAANEPAQVRSSILQQLMDSRLTTVAEFKSERSLVNRTDNLKL